MKVRDTSNSDGPSFRFRPLLRKGVICCGLAVLLSSGCGKKPPDETAKTGAETTAPATATATPTPGAPGTTPAESSSAVETPAGALSHAAALVEKGEVKQFMETYFPPKMVAQMKESPQWKKDVPAEFITVFKSIAPKIRQYGQSKPEMSSDGTRATFKLVASGETANAETSTPIPAPKEVATTTGFGGDLAKALGDAAATLEKKDYAGFVDKMFPPTQLAVIDRDGGRDRYLLRLADNPKMAERMIADLKLAQAAKPTLASDGNSATVEVASVDQGGPARKLVFQKVSGHWRLQDSAKQTHQEISRISGLGPIKLASPRQAPVELVLIKDGNRWRFENPNVIEPGR